MEKNQDDSCSMDDVVEVHEQPSNEVDIKVSNISVKIKSRLKDRHKTVECRICLRKMKSDKLKRHLKTHRDFHHLDDDELREEIKREKN